MHIAVSMTCYPLRGYECISAIRVKPAALCCAIMEYLFYVLNCYALKCYVLKYYELMCDVLKGTVKAFNTNLKLNSTVT